MSTVQTGNLAMIFYALITALSSILIHSSTQEMSPLLSACNTFLLCLLAYSIFSFRTLQKVSLVKKNSYSIFMLNVTTAICWIFTFISLKYISPELYLFTYLSAMPISGAIIFRNKMRKAISLLIGLIALFYTYHDSNLLIGILLAFFGGVSGTIYSVYSKRITQYFTTTEILSMRFYLTVMVTFVLCIIFGEWKVLMPVDYEIFIALSLVSVVIPLTLFQVGLKNLNITKALAYMPLAPLICYLLNFSLGYIEFNLFQVGVVAFLCVAMFL